MKLRVAIPRSLTAVPLLLMARDNPSLVDTAYFSDHEAALEALARGGTDLLCTGYTETDRLAEGSKPMRICTFVWGLSAIMVRDASLHTLRDLVEYCYHTEGVELTLPFVGSPLDIQMRALLRLQLTDGKILVANRPLPETMQRWRSGELYAAVFPEPMATILETAGQAMRLADIADLWASVNNGERRSPQVSLFCKSGFDLPMGFMKALQSSIRTACRPSPSDLKYLAGELALPIAILNGALQHAILELPDAMTVMELERAYKRVLQMS
jgi:hypothetical protein